MPAAGGPGPRSPPLCHGPGPRPWGSQSCLRRAPAGARRVQGQAAPHAGGRWMSGRRGRGATSPGLDLDAGRVPRRDLLPRQAADGARGQDGALRPEHPAAGLGREPAHPGAAGTSSPAHGKGRTCLAGSGQLAGKDSEGRDAETRLPTGRPCPPTLRARPRAPQTTPRGRACLELSRVMELGCDLASAASSLLGLAPGLEAREAGRRTLPSRWRGRTRVCRTRARPAGRGAAPPATCGTRLRPAHNRGPPPRLRPTRPAPHAGGGCPDRLTSPPRAPTRAVEPVPRASSLPASTHCPESRAGKALSSRLRLLSAGKPEVGPSAGPLAQAWLAKSRTKGHWVATRTMMTRHHPASMAPGSGSADPADRTGRHLPQLLGGTEALTPQTLSQRPLRTCPALLDHPARPAWSWGRGPLGDGIGLCPPGVAGLALWRTPETVPRECAHGRRPRSGAQLPTGLCRAG